MNYVRIIELKVCVGAYGVFLATKNPSPAWKAVWREASIPPEALSPDGKKSIKMPDIRKEGSLMTLDTLLLIPTPPPEAYFLKAELRQSLGPLSLRMLAASYELETFIGRDLGFDASVYPPTALSSRSLTAVTLATHLDKAGLIWAVVDPGERSLDYWRSELIRQQRRRPSTIAVSTTYFMSSEWLNLLLEMCREISPQATIIVGGYMYGTASEEFLSLKADIICVGEGEERLPILVQACINGQNVEVISGIYFRENNGSLKYTGDPKPLNLSSLNSPDWTLSREMVPAVDPEEFPLSIGVETQRGCLFKCQFCTFRTLASPSALNVTESVDAIFSTARYSKGSQIVLADPTATFPRPRWRDIMTLLAERGGAPHPMFAYARVNDLDGETVDVMTRANVRNLFIGQESGDPSVLAAMRKGTNLEHVRKCIAALYGSPIDVTMGFIHGYPGETPTTMQATRALICSLNEHFQQRPVVARYTLTPFTLQDLATVSYDERLIHKHVPAKLAVEEILATFIASSRIDHAPLMFGVGPTSFVEPFSSVQERDRYKLFKWYKAVQRGVAIFLEKDVDGKMPNDRELRSIREEINRPMTSPSRQERSIKRRISRRFKTSVLRSLSRELSNEEKKGAGLLTRCILARVDYSAHRNVSRSARCAWSVGRGSQSDEHVVELASSLVSSAMSLRKQKAAGSRERILQASRRT